MSNNNSTEQEQNDSLQSSVINVAANLREVQSLIESSNNKNKNAHKQSVRLVAVSKTKPIELLQQAYEAGCRVFGENYVQELVEKVPQMPKDIQWHYIGALQTNKANKLLSVFDKVSCLTVETVDKIKLAHKLDKAVKDKGTEEKLNIYVQVNTSAEESKSGCSPEEVVELCQQITNECSSLDLKGLMTIGAPGDLTCFDTLVQCRNKVGTALGRDDLELSMGMSGDFMEAIAAGATNVRVGSTIFGARDYSK